MDIKKEITLTATSTLDTGEPIMSFRASVNSLDPNTMHYTAAVVNQALYRINRDKAKEDQKVFEDALYEEQDRMIALAQSEVES